MAMAALLALMLLVQSACGQAFMAKTSLYALTVDPYGKLLIYEGRHPKAQVRDYCRKHDMGRQACAQIRSHICSVDDLIEPCRGVPAYTLRIDGPGVDKPLEIFPDDEPADEAYHYCLEYGLSDETLATMLHHLCDEDEGNVISMCSRKKPKTRDLFRLYLSTSTVKDYEVAVSDVDTPTDVAKRIQASFCPNGTPVGSKDTCNIQKMEAMVQAKLNNYHTKQEEKLFAEDGADLFAMLGVSRTADQRELKKAYKRLSLKVRRLQGQQLARIHTCADSCVPLSTLGSYPLVPSRQAAAGQ
jgi:hypothetical protein